MAATIIFLLVIAIALGSLFFLLGYGTLFLSAFSLNKKFSLISLITLAFSSVGFVMFGLPWYYCLPLWFIPPIYAQMQIPASRNKSLAVKGFWIGTILLITSLSSLAYITYSSLDVEGTKAKLEQKRKELLIEQEQKQSEPSPLINPPDPVPTK